MGSSPPCFSAGGLCRYKVSVLPTFSLTLINQPILTSRCHEPILLLMHIPSNLCGTMPSPLLCPHAKTCLPARACQSRPVHAYGKHTRFRLYSSDNIVFALSWESCLKGGRNSFQGGGHRASETERAGRRDGDVEGESGREGGGRESVIARTSGPTQESLATKAAE